MCTVLNTYLITRIKRFFIVLLIALFDIFQLWIVLHLQIKAGNNNLTGYVFSLSNRINLTTFTIFYLFLSPFLFSYFSITRSARQGLVEIVGKGSLYHVVNQQFHPGNPEGRELSEENIQVFLNELARGEPPGTLENLNMLLSLGISVSKIIENSGIKSIKRVFISDQDIPNAFTLRILPIPYLGEDWIILNRNVVDILEPDEIKAVVAHEIAHAARKDSWLNSFLSAPKLMIVFGWSIVFFKLIQIIFEEELTGFSFARVFIVFLFLALMIYSVRIMNLMTDYTYRQSEFLADHYAAKFAGSEELVNALIKIGKRAEVMNSIQRELKWLSEKNAPVNLNELMMFTLNAIPVKELSLRNARFNVINMYVRNVLLNTFRSLKINIPPEQFEKMITDSVNSLLELRETEPIKVLQGNLLISDNQQTIDLQKDENLTRPEIKDLTGQLKQSGKQIFENEVLENLGLLPKTRTHPQISSRIIFLYDSLIKNEVDHE